LSSLANSWGCVCDVDLVKKLLHVRRSKNETSQRVIRLNASALIALARMFERADMLGHTEPGHYLWPACQWGQFDPTNPMLKWDTAWRALRDAAGLHGLRFHDLRHTVIIELAEMGVADHVLESITGHLSRRMLEHYSHIRIAPSGRRSTPWTCSVAARCLKRARATAATRRTPTSRRPSTCPKASRHSHVTV
jgi:integrase